jgi:outer membrane receptor for ferrienterochelin and colicins
MLSAFTLLVLVTTVVFGQEPPRATVVIEVKAAAAPVDKAVVSVNGTAVTTDKDGIARTTVRLGTIEVTVKKEGFLPATASLSVDHPAREFQLHFDLQPERHEDEEVTVFATRTDKRLQDLPTRVEVLAREEIEEKMLMTPGDITMMLKEMGGMRVQTTSPSLGAASVSHSGNAGALHALSIGWLAAFRPAGRRPRAPPDSTHGLGPSRGD